MVNQLLNALVRSKNEAADDVLVEALRLGEPQEKKPVLEAVLYRKAVRSLCGVVKHYDELPEPLQVQVLGEIKSFHPALREAGRSADAHLRLSAMKLIALGRQGKLAYVLSENLHDSDLALSKAAVEAMVALARWIATETRRLQKGAWLTEKHDAAPPSSATGAHEPAFDSASLYHEIMAQRPEIESAVARALDVHRGRHGQEILRAALLLCDWPGSKTLAILHTAKHGGQSPMVRRLQQPPTSDSVEAFLLGASHGQLRSHFGIAFAHINEAPVLDALLRKTHWLADHQLQVCLHQVTRGAWLTPAELARDIDRRTPQDAALVGQWISASGAHDVAQDERLCKLLAHCAGNFHARLRLLRVALGRKRGASVQLLRTLLADADERIVRMAAREIVRRRPADLESMLLPLMTTAPQSVRRVIGRAVGQSGFDSFWSKFDRLNRPTRQQAGRAMLKILPDAAQRLRRRLSAGTPELRIKAMQITQELGLADDLRDAVIAACGDANPRLRSKAVSVLGELKVLPTEVVIDRLITDTDARVRANAIEVMETRPDNRLLPVLHKRIAAANNRERANAIKALHRMRVQSSAAQLLQMIRDPRPEHRISGLWTLKEIGWWQMMNEVGRVARDDADLKVRRYAVGVLKGVCEMAKQRQQKTAGAG